MSAEAVKTLSMQLKKTLIERALKAELGYHLDRRIQHPSQHVVLAGLGLLGHGWSLSRGQRNRKNWQQY